MVPQPSSFSPPAPALAPLPRWISAARPQTAEETAFCAGAALAHLHGEIARPEVPQALLRARLALGAAQAVLRLEGRREVLAALRDAVHLLGPGDQPDPMGAASGMTAAQPSAANLWQATGSSVT